MNKGIGFLSTVVMIVMATQVIAADNQTDKLSGALSIERVSEPAQGTHGAILLGYTADSSVASDTLVPSNQTTGSFERPRATVRHLSSGTDENTLVTFGPIRKSSRIEVFDLKGNCLTEFIVTQETTLNQARWIIPKECLDRTGRKNFLFVVTSPKGMKWAGKFLVEKRAVGKVSLRLDD